MENTDEHEDGVMEGLHAGPGERLRAARETAGLTLDQVAADTRIPVRHLETIEAGKFGSLPGRTYAVGFSRTYAKLVGLDQDEIVAQVRDELGVESAEHYEASAGAYEPGDPNRAPTGGLVWMSLVAVVLLLAGGYMFYNSFLSPSADLPAQVAEGDSDAQTTDGEGDQQSAAADVDPNGAVVFAAQGTAWVRFNDADGNRLYEAEMSEGQSFTVPADAQGPVLITGRPDLLNITIGGKPVPKISEELTTVVDVPVSAQALLDRTPAPTAEPEGE